MAVSSFTFVVVVGKILITLHAPPRRVFRGKDFETGGVAVRARVSALEQKGSEHCRSDKRQYAVSCHALCVAAAHDTLTSQDFAQGGTARGICAFLGGRGGRGRTRSAGTIRGGIGAVGAVAICRSIDGQGLCCALHDGHLGRDIHRLQVVQRFRIETLIPEGMTRVHKLLDRVSDTRVLYVAALIDTV